MTHREVESTEPGEDALPSAFPSAAPEPDWRHALLRKMLRLTGWTLLVATGLATLLTRTAHWEFIAPAVAGAGSFLLLCWVKTQQRLVSAIYSLMLFVVIVTVAWHWYWSFLSTST